MLFLSIHIFLVFEFLLGYFVDLIDINSLDAVAFIIVIARPAGVGFLAFLAEFSGHGSTSHIPELHRISRLAATRPVNVQPLGARSTG